MHIYRRLVLVCGFLFLIGPASSAQSSPPVSSQPATTLGQGRVTALAFQSQTPETGEPYFAIEETRNSQTLSDGTHVDREANNRHMYRDSQGRTRVEFYLTMPSDGPEEPRLMGVVIHDPVTGTAYGLDVQNHKATVLSLRAVQRPPAVNQNANASALKSATPSATDDQYRPQATGESLGTNVMEGLTVMGHRETMTYPVGARGNDRPFSVVTETWTSTELGVVVLSRIDDPRSGVLTTRLTKIDRTEPDPSLFQVPADYTIEDRANK